MTVDRKTFFDACRAGVMGPTLDQDEVAGAEAILDAMAGAPMSWTAYALATAWHETAHTMLPIKERGGPNYFFRMYDIAGQRPAKARELGNLRPGDGVLFCGRGYVQLTGRANYCRAGEEIGEPLERYPDLAMRPEIAARILRSGMEEGWFTGKRFAHFLPVVGPARDFQFHEARRIINVLDRARDIAGYALQFQAAVLAAS